MKILIFIFFFTLCFLTTVGQKIINDSKKEKTISVKGRVVSYKVIKPEFWKASIDPYSGYSEYSYRGDEIVHYQSVVEIYKNMPNDFETGGVKIDVRNIEKYDKSLTDVFQKYLHDYEVKSGKIEKEETGVKNPKYESVSSLIHTTGSDMNQYTVGIDPGIKYKYDIIISMLISHGRRATEEEMAIFKKIVNSFRMLKRVK